MEQNKVNRNEKLGEYFLNLSNTTLGTSVLGAMVSSVLTDNVEAWLVVAIITIGLIMTIIFAGLGDKFLKK
jgi:hypothetical protein